MKNVMLRATRTFIEDLCAPEYAHNHLAVEISHPDGFTDARRRLGHHAIALASGPKHRGGECALTGMEVHVWERQLIQRGGAALLMNLLLVPSFQRAFGVCRG